MVGYFEPVITIQTSNWKIHIFWIMVIHLMFIICWMSDWCALLTDIKLMCLLELDSTEIFPLDPIPLDFISFGQLLRLYFFPSRLVFGLPKTVQKYTSRLLFLKGRETLTIFPVYLYDIFWLLPFSNQDKSFRRC